MTPLCGSSSVEMWIEGKNRIAFPGHKISVEEKVEFQSNNNLNLKGNTP